MESYNTSPQGRDARLWNLAQRRAAFKRHFTIYIIINVFLWLLWLFTGSDSYNSGLPWPVWPTLGWGIGLAFHYIGAYLNTGTTSVDKEYEKLMREQSNKHL